MTYLTGDTPRPDPEKVGLRTQIANQKLKIAALEEQARQKDEQIARLQELVRDQDDAMRAKDDLRRRWGK